MLTPIGYICGLSARLEMDAGLSSDDLPRKAPGERGGGGLLKEGLVAVKLATGAGIRSMEKKPDKREGCCASVPGCLRL
jgi:hypothetical protein